MNLFNITLYKKCTLLKPSAHNENIRNYLLTKGFKQHYIITRVMG